MFCLDADVKIDVLCVEVGPMFCVVLLDGRSWNISFSANFVTSGYKQFPKGLRIAFQDFFYLLTAALNGNSEAQPDGLPVRTVRTFRFVLVAYNPVVRPSGGSVRSGDVGIVLRLGSERFLVRDAPIILQPLSGRQFFTPSYFLTAPSPKIMVIFIICLGVLNVYSYNLSF